MCVCVCVCACVRACVRVCVGGMVDECEGYVHTNMKVKLQFVDFLVK